MRKYTCSIDVKTADIITERIMVHVALNQNNINITFTRRNTFAT
jgi:hypothetical protein